MTQKHTREPWPHFVTWCEPSSPHPDSEGIVRLGFEDYCRARACVNACVGWETSQLEAMEMGSLRESLLRVMDQRDQLLEALHDAATSLETIQLRSFGEDSFLDSKPEMRSYAGSRAAVAREAIAKAKGGAAIAKITGETK